MKKKLCLILAVCFIFCSFAFAVNAEEEYEAYEGNVYIKGELVVWTNVYIEPVKCEDGESVDFFGISVTEIDALFTTEDGGADRWAELSNNRFPYGIKLVSGVDTREAAAALSENENVIEASLNWVIYPDWDWGTDTCKTESSPFIGMSEEELKAHWRFVPDEFTLCLDSEIDLTEFEGEDKHYLYGVLIDDISRVESEGSFVYNVKIGAQYIRNDDAFKVFEGNENVEWVEYETMYGNGDINEDGKTDSLDYLMASRMCFKSYEATRVELGYADVNFDGTIESADYLLIKRAAFGTYPIG